MQTSENKEYEQFFAEAIEINPSVFPYYDNDKTNSIDTLNVNDPLDENVTFCSTIGLSDFPNKIEMKDDSLLNIPVELLMAG
ncbi:MAG: suppressor of fused domain protein [Sphingobacterium sp.]|jgi:hypothetical protein|nr:suppressor of fused domain protein [Sphingobacterium sp.]